ncbi:hypothetical protein D9757_001477 [Collybiopsis confluens]|nr:hypothetical protein D9757_001477 [Collybiopsis confluens]
MPDTLKEHMVICTTYQKPLVFFHLVLSRNIVDALVFTKSAESTSRLVKLLEFFQDAYLRLAREDRSRSGETKMKYITVRAYSSDLPSAERKSILEKFKAKEIQILVCSDLISRGIDISHVSHVVSYDSPVDMRKYVHRVGRTARAGREGDAWTLIEEQEARHFKMMMKEANHLSQVKRLRIRERDLDPLVSCYEVCTASLFIVDPPNSFIYDVFLVPPHHKLPLLPSSLFSYADGAVKPKRSIYTVITSCSCIRA